MKQKLKNLIADKKNIVFFGGAGVSTESGIPDFRSGDGLFHREKTIPPEILISRNYFFENTELFYAYYKENLMYPDAKPHNTHKTLVYLEQIGKLSGIITQNIDHLHQKAGSKNVIELHGSVKRNYCLTCGKFFDDTYILASKTVPYCDSCNGLIKPDVVLYGESLDNENIEEAISLLLEADLLIIGGTSLSVYPAASLINYYTGDDIVLINKDKTLQDEKATIIIRDNIGSVLDFVSLE